MTEIPDYEDDWKRIQLQSKNSPEIAFFRKNIGVSRLKGHANLGTLVYLTVNYEPKDETGLPSKSDTALLYDFEEEVIPEVEREARCVLVATVTKAGVKDHLFYLSDFDSFLQEFDCRSGSLDGFGISLEKQEDAQWSTYSQFPGD